MFAHIALGTALVLASVSSGSLSHSPEQWSKNQQIKLFRKAVAQLNECVIRKVSERMATAGKSEISNEELPWFINDSMPYCKKLAHHLINLTDEFFGTGQGERFIKFQYLIELPRVVEQALTKQEKE